MINEIKYWWNKTRTARNFFIVFGAIVTLICVLSMDDFSQTDAAYIKNTPLLYEIIFGATSGFIAYIFVFWVYGGAFIIIANILIKLHIVEPMPLAEYRKYIRDNGRLLGE